MLPEWVELTPYGHAPLLVFAPHGGRRRGRREPGRHKVNDLHTVEIAHELARRCGASCLVNEERDRNEIDLNRISQVRRAAPWLLEFLATTCTALVARHGRATVLVIHGWNTIQPICDVGAGVVERAGRLVRPGAGHRTAGDGCLRHRVGRLRVAAAADGVAITIGVRYPAAHPNNLLQVFTPAARDDEDVAMRTLAELSARGCLDALQLELGIPLRWPGRYRIAFMRALTAIWSADPPADGPPIHERVLPPAPRGLVSGGRPTRRRALQFVDGPIMGLASIDGSDEGAIGGRLLISSADSELALFTGEVGVYGAGTWELPPLRCPETPAGFRVLFEGVLLHFPTLTPFLDLERGLATGRLLEAAVDLAVARGADSTKPGDHPGTATVRGTIRLDGTTHRIDTAALLADGGTGATLRPPGVRVVLPTTPLGQVTLRSDPRGAPELHRAFIFSLRGEASRDATTTAVTGMIEISLLGTTGQLQLTLEHASQGPLRRTAVLERLIPVRRPGPRGSVVRTTYGLVRFADASHGWIELTVMEEPLD